MYSIVLRLHVLHGNYPHAYASGLCEMRFGAKYVGDH